VALVGVAGNHTDSVVAEVGAALFSASIVSFAVAGPITLYRWYRARQGVAAAFAAGLQYKARHGTPPDQQ